MDNGKHDQDALNRLAEQAHDAFKEAGYEIGLGEFPHCKPLSWSLNHQCAILLAHADFGSGGLRDVVISFRDAGDCGIFAGPMYDVPSGKTREDITLPVADYWCGCNFPRPDLYEFLLVKARKLMLSPDYFPGMASPD